MKKRHVIEIIPARRTSDGDGVKIKRIVGRHGMIDLDPFLLLDEIKSDESKDYIGGFPPHPHRGFETITYMKNGSFRHNDHLGNEGSINSGGAQWMTAGSGVIHSEMPEQEHGSLHGFQIWLNLPAKDKMQKASYRNIQAEQMPNIVVDRDIAIKLLAGDLYLEGKTYQGPIRGQSTKPIYGDITLPEGKKVSLPLDEAYNGYIYLYEGALTIENKIISAQSLVRLGKGDEVTIMADMNARFLLLAGIPIGEPIANYGPFVMNTKEEIDRAVREYQDGTLTDESHIL